MICKYLIIFLFLLQIKCLFLSNAVFNFRHNQCPLHDPLIRYCEYILALIVTCNLINYLYKFCCNYVTYEKVTITSTQKKLLGIKDFGKYSYFFHLKIYVNPF